MESQVNGNGETAIAGSEGSASDGKHIKWLQRQGASGQLGTFPGPETLPRPWKGKADGRNEKRDAGNGVNRVALGETLLPQTLDKCTKTGIKLRG